MTSKWGMCYYNINGKWKRKRKNYNYMNIKKLTVTAMLLASALIVFMIEAALPPLTPIPGIKMGLANIITLIALAWLGGKDAFLILILRVILGAVFSGTVLTMVYSMAGGITSFAIMALLLKLIGKNRIVAVSIIGAVVHNAAQIATAVLITSVWQIIMYLPILLVCAIITGTFTGFIAQEILKRKDIKI